MIIFLLTSAIGAYFNQERRILLHPLFIHFIDFPFEFLSIHCLKMIRIHKLPTEEENWREYKAKDREGGGGERPFNEEGIQVYWGVLVVS